MKKIVKFLNHIFDLITYKILWLSSKIYTDSNEYGYKFAWAPNIYLHYDNWHDWGIAFNWFIYSFELNGIKSNPPRLCVGYTINIRPLDWSFGGDHIYYDGPHCSYDFGPIRFQSMGTNWNCKGCELVK